MVVIFRREDEHTYLLCSAYYLLYERDRGTALIMDGK